MFLDDTRKDVNNIAMSFRLKFKIKIKLSNVLKIDIIMIESRCIVS